MANAKFLKGDEGFLDGSIDWDTHTIKACLLDLNVSDTGVKQISAATNATPIVITTNTHGFTTGDKVAITGVLGNTAANANWIITVVTSTTFSLDTSVGNGAYTSGGVVVNLTLADNLDDIDGCIVGTDQTLAGKTVTNGIADADDITFPSGGSVSVEAVALYKSTGTASTSRLICLIDTAPGLPITTGGPIDVNWSNTAATKIFHI